MKRHFHEKASNIFFKNSEIVLTQLEENKDEEMKLEVSYKMNQFIASLAIINCEQEIKEILPNSKCKNISDLNIEKFTIQSMVLSNTDIEGTNQLSPTMVTSLLNVINTYPLLVESYRYVDNNIIISKNCKKLNAMFDQILKDKLEAQNRFKHIKRLENDYQKIDECNFIEAKKAILMGNEYECKSIENFRNSIYYIHKDFKEKLNSGMKAMENEGELYEQIYIPDSIDKSIEAKELFLSSPQNFDEEFGAVVDIKWGAGDDENDEENQFDEMTTEVLYSIPMEKRR